MNIAAYIGVRTSMVNFFAGTRYKISFVVHWAHIFSLKREPVHIRVQRSSALTNDIQFLHYGDVIVGAIASQITSLTIVYSTVYSGADQSKHHSSASLAFVWGSHRDRWSPRTKGQLRGKYFHLMTSSCIQQGCHESFMMSLITERATVFSALYSA